MLRNLLIKTRTYRRFDQSEKVPTETLQEVIENVRYACSPANLQPLKFIIINDEKINSKVFPHLRWAGYLKDWDGPEEGERPVAYIVILGDKKISPNFISWDYGIALQTILLSLTNKGLGACPFASFNKDEIRKILNIPEELESPLIIAIGKPVEKVVIDDIKNGDVKYWRDDTQTHHVPKRKVEDLIFNIYS
jgi:nitroreductase